MKIQQNLVLVLLFFLFLNCRSERSSCYSDNKFDVGRYDDACGLAVGSYASAELTKSNDDGKVSVDTYQRIGDSFLLQCIDNIAKKKNCDKKSDLTPHVW